MSWDDAQADYLLNLHNAGERPFKIAYKLNERFGTTYTGQAVTNKLTRQYLADPSAFTRAHGRYQPIKGSSDKYDALPDSTILALLQARDDECLPATAPRYAMTSQKAHSVCRAIDIALAESEAA